jgi:hypothetical protein
MKEEKKMNNQKCLKELSEKQLYELLDNEQLDSTFHQEVGGRLHLYFFCQVCQREHLWITADTGVVPNQPALGWQY